ncbi:ABC transporter substrate-binding protein [Actinopolymorpha pittospori]
MTGVRHRSGELSRRELLRTGAGALLVATATTSCDLLSTDPSDKGANGQPPRGNEAASARNGREAPTLAERVKAGKLPPVQERLPADPLTVKPNDRVGVYGGEWRSAIAGPSDAAWLQRTTGYETLMRWDLQFEKVIPNVAKEVKVEDGGSNYVFTLRRGMRWSSGEPFTADDIVFAYESVMGNTDLYPDGPPDFCKVRGKPGTIEKVDDQTVRFSFAAPNGLFLENLATLYSSDLTNLPRHYFEKFHAEFNPDAQALAKQEGEGHWATLFQAKMDTWSNPEHPVLFPWVPVTVFGEGQRLVYERNPYYWKVDPQGSQLPYLDRLVMAVIGEPETMTLRASGGEIDMQDRTINTPVNKPVLARYRESGDFDFFDEVPTSCVTFAIALNLNHKDPVKRQIFQNRDFRVGLSLAINRQEIINVVYQRQGEPFQVAPRPDSPMYDEEMAKQYTEFDAAAANEHLDRAGFRERDNAGFRLGPDGRRITIGVEHPSGPASQTDPLELVKGYWKQVGVELQNRPEDRSLFEERRTANQHDATTWGAEGGGKIEPILRPDWFLPSRFESINYAPLWMQWYESNGRAGERPPEIVQQQMALYRKMNETVDPDERITQMKEVLRIAKEYFYHIGISLAPPGYGIVKNNFHNVPDKMPASFIWPSPGPSNPEQYFIQRT